MTRLLFVWCGLLSLLLVNAGCFFRPNEKYACTTKDDCLALGPNADCDQERSICVTTPTNGKPHGVSDSSSSSAGTSSGDTTSSSSEGSSASSVEGSTSSSSEGSTSSAQTSSSSYNQVAKQLALGGEFTCALMEDETVRCRGEYAANTSTTGCPASPNEQPVVAGMVELTAGHAHVCARNRDGGVVCWGRDTEGQLNSPGNCVPPTTMLNGAPFDHVVAGWSGTCVTPALDGGPMECWGNNEYGHLSPERAAKLPGAFLGLTIGYRHSCAIVPSTDETYCWGENVQSALGFNLNYRDGGPVPVSGDGGGVWHGFVEVAAASDFTCARDNQNRTYCWGYNIDAQLGTDDVAPHYLPTAVVDGGTDMAELAPGWQHSCARTLGGRAQCWGRRNFGQTGTGGVDSEREYTPANVRVSAGQLLQNVIKIASGRLHSCAIVSGGQVWCWGSNRSQQIGAETATMGYAVRVTF